ncbi:MAG: hypothetical protein NXI04_02375 [Planctomycetaceae bacterium]|nr:hypothetical protein [Planctomycetaceae bacterium]
MSLVEQPETLSTAESLAPDASSQPADAVPPADMWGRLRLRTLAVIFLAALPFWSIPLAHIGSEPTTATGLYQYELPYYIANGRSAFERGNGVTYPNPYDPDAAAPAIYAHWFPWTLGLLTSVIGWEPGDTLLAIGVVVSLAFSAATYHLVSCRLADCRRRESVSWPFLFAMWGGGLLVIAGVLFPSRGLDGVAEHALQFDPGRGMWFLSWGRNALFPTEAIYHALVAVCWTAEIRGRKLASNACLLLLATTHPWSGLQLLLTVCGWRFCCWVTAELRPQGPLISDRSHPAERIPAAESEHAIGGHADGRPGCVRDSRVQLLTSGSILVLFLTYYKWWLPSFASHARLENVWRLDWSLPTLSAVLAWCLVAVPAILMIKRGWAPRAWSRSTRFFVTALVVSLGLALHDRVISPVQPLHFTRGYVWMPLFLLGLPVLLEWSGRLQRAAGPVIMVVVAVVFWMDNMAFCTVHMQRQWLQQDGFHLDSDDRALMRSLSVRATGRVVLTQSQTVNYLLPTYAPVRPWLGHHFNTPDYPDRKAVWQKCFADGRVHVDSIPADVGILVVRRFTDMSELTATWERMPDRNAAWCLWTRRRDVASGD